MLAQESKYGINEQERPTLLGDVDEWLFHKRGSESTYIIGSITVDRYLTVPESKLPVVRAFMQRLTGENTLNDIRRDLIREHGVDVDVWSLYRKCFRAGLIARGARAPVGDIQGSSATLIRVPIGRLLCLLQRASFVARPMLWTAAVLIVLALIAVLGDSSLLRLAADSTVAGSSVLRNVWLTLMIGCVSVLAHELSHCLAAAAWGIVNGILRIELYLGVIPVVGLKLTGLYTLPANGRLAVWGAGVVANLALVGAAVLLLKTVLPGSATLELALTINWLLAVFNLIPVLTTDGYFILSTLVKDSNVRVRAWDWVCNPLQRDRERPSWFVLLYVIATGCLLLSTLLHLALRIAYAQSAYPLLESTLSALVLALCVVMLWRTICRKEESQ